MLASDPDVNFRGALSDHKDFYMDDGNVIFLVENTYFKVHRFFFQRDSQFFRDTFDRLPAGPCTSGDLITLTDITSLDFERFLGVLYPRDFSKPTATTVDEWTSILDLSMRWGFESIQSLATEHLTLLASPIDKIVLGRKYHITEWLQNAYRTVCQREHTLTLEEGLRLGMAEVINISHARQAVRQDMTLVPPSRLHSVIEDTFGLGPAPELPPLSGRAPGTDSDKTQFDEWAFNGNMIHGVDAMAKDPDAAEPEADIGQELVLPPPQQWHCGSPALEECRVGYGAIAEEPRLVEPMSPPFPSNDLAPWEIEGYSPPQGPLSRRKKKRL
jgi:hypothetical protein